MFKLRAISLALALGVAAPASAAAVLDQTSLVGDGFTFPTWQGAGFAPGAPNPPYGYLQSFTAGITGELDSIAFGLVNNTGAPYPLTFSLFAGVPNNIGDAPVYTTTWAAPQFNVPLNVYIPWSTLPTIDLSAAHIDVVAGQTYTFALTTPTAANYQLSWLDYVNGVPFTVDGGDKYSVYYGGQAVKIQPFGGDFAFRTFVSAGVPEPGTWALMIFGFATTGAALRRRARTV
jgi:hypothetical protein